MDMSVLVIATLVVVVLLVAIAAAVAYLSRRRSGTVRAAVTQRPAAEPKEDER